MVHRTALAAAILLLTGCTAPDVPTVSPTPATATGSVASPATAVPVPDYAGPQPMPASDGGPMLWPAPVEVTMEDKGFGTETTHYGFVDASGKLVVPQRYESYEYCYDDAGRAAFVLGSGVGRRVDVLDLTGAVIRRTPTTVATCGPAGTVVFTREIDPSGDQWRDGLMEVRTGRVVVPLARNRHIQLVDEHIVNVSEPGGEYFFDTRTGTRTPHPGELMNLDPEPGTPGVPATASGGAVGYVDRRGTWRGVAGVIDASGFHGGVAVAQLDEERYTFLDARLQRVGGVWGDIQDVSVDVAGTSKVVGYVVSGGAGQGLLAADLRTIVEPGPAVIRCDGDDLDAACSVLADDGTAKLVLLPKGTVTAIPEGFSQALGRSFVADLVPADDDTTSSSRVLALGTGRVAELRGPSSCAGVGTRWAVCEPESDVLPTVVLDAQARRTGFRTIEPVLDAVRGGGAVYYWATTGRYAGFVDENGAWRYRQRRFTRLED